MFSQPEKGTALFKIKAALALGASAVALAAPAETISAKNVKITPQRNELFVDHIAQIAMLGSEKPKLLNGDKAAKVGQDIDNLSSRYNSKVSFTNKSGTHFTTSPHERQKPIFLSHEGKHHNTSNSLNVRLSPWVKHWLYTLRGCESAYTYTENSGNGYFGAYQIDPSTWQHLGLKGLPNQAPPIVQDEAIIKNTETTEGGISSQNPGCYETTHLSEFLTTSDAVRLTLIAQADRVLSRYG